MAFEAHFLSVSAAFEDAYIALCIGNDQIVQAALAEALIHHAAESYASCGVGHTDEVLFLHQVTVQRDTARAVLNAVVVAFDLGPQHIETVVVEFERYV